MKIGNKEFVLGERTYIMGILNVTPDSFSDGGKFNELETADKKSRTNDKRWCRYNRYRRRIYKT